MKKNLQLIIAGLVVVLLGAGYLALTLSAPKAKEEKKGLHVVDRDADELASVAISVNGKEPFTVNVSGRASSKTYQIANYPADFKLKTGALDSLVSYTTQIDASKIVEEHPTDLAQYGLDVPKSTVKTMYKDGKPDVIRIGGASSLGDGFFAMVNDDSAVYLVPINIGNILSSDLYFFRLPDLLPEWGDPSTSVKSVSLNYKGKEIALKRLTSDEKKKLSSDSSFYLTKPKESPVNDNYLIAQFITPVAELYSSAAVCKDLPQDLASYGLKNAAALLAVTASDGTEYRILIGNQTSDQSGYYVMREGAKTVTVVQAAVIKSILEADPDALISGETAK